MNNTQSITEYQCLVRNISTPEKTYDELFRTEVSELLAKNRAIEKANTINAQTPNTYDPDDYIVRARTNIITYGVWSAV